jgi:hypothetical protein
MPDFFITDQVFLTHPVEDSKKELNKNLTKKFWASQKLSKELSPR